NQSETQNTSVNLEMTQKRGKRDPLDGIERSQGWHQPIRQKQSANTAKHGQKYALGKQLLDETPTTGAKGATKCQFAFPGDPTGQLKIRNVRATNKQKKSDTAHQVEPHSIKQSLRPPS